MIFLFTNDVYINLFESYQMYIYLWRNSILGLLLLVSSWKLSVSLFIFSFSTFSVFLILVTLILFYFYFVLIISCKFYTNHILSYSSSHILILVVHLRIILRKVKILRWKRMAKFNTKQKNRLERKRETFLHNSLSFYPGLDL